jgi:hypothetical protein
MLFVGFIHSAHKNKKKLKNNTQNSTLVGILSFFVLLLRHEMRFTFYVQTAGAEVFLTLRQICPRSTRHLRYLVEERHLALKIALTWNILKLNSFNSSDYLGE